MLEKLVLVSAAVVAFISQSALPAFDLTIFQHDRRFSSVETGTPQPDGLTPTAGSGSADISESKVTLTALDVSSPPKRDPVDQTSSGLPVGSASANDPPDPLDGLGAKQADSWCGWAPYNPQPPAGDPLWNGRDPSMGVLKWKSCPVLFPGAPGSPGNMEGRTVVTQFFDNQQPDTPVVQVDPRILAEQAIRDLQIPAPSIHLGPDATQIFVQIPTWLWIDEPGTLSASVTAGTVTVSAAATLASTTWTLGEPKRNPSFTGFEPGPAVTVTCQGAGTPPPADVDWKAEPPCGHTFRWRSLPERTAGSGEWPITATTSWDVTWQSNTGQSGVATLTATSQDAVAVGEYRILLVDGGR